MWGRHEDEEDARKNNIMMLFFRTPFFNADMPLTAIIGAQWGDEGKGRITDLLAARAHVTARYSGGDNAGHTVTIGEQVFKLHLLPSGILQPDVVGVMGNGMVVNPARLLEEMDKLRALGVDVSPERVKLSHAAHLITPAHIALDKAEDARRAGGRIGTTARGIGPAYNDKAARRGIRAESLRNPEVFGDLVLAHARAANRLLEGIYDYPALDASGIAAEYCAYARRLSAYLADTSLYLDAALKAGQTVLAEGAQGTLLDIDHGTYPYVTSSSASIGGVFTGLGVRPHYLDRVVGVTKAFQTRVGEGPFPTEVFGKAAEQLRGSGANPWDEFGTTTGRPRRCGWLDLVLLRYAVRINGITELALTKLDVLTGLETSSYVSPMRRRESATKNCRSVRQTRRPSKPFTRSCRAGPWTCGVVVLWRNCLPPRGTIFAG